jgi:hypothetical protein
VVRPSALAKSLIRRGFLGLRAVSPPLVVLKEVLPVLKGKDPTTDARSCSVSITSVPVFPPVISPSLPVDKQRVESPCCCCPAFVAGLLVFQWDCCDGAYSH